MPIRKEKEKLIFLRQKIQQLDQKIFELVLKRLECSREIGQVKIKNKTPIENLEQEKKILKEDLKVAENLGLDKSISKALVQNLIKLCKQDQLALLAELQEDVKRTLP